MQTNRVKAALKAGEAVTGPIINEMRTVGGVKIMALAGHDFLFIDMEHALFNWETTLTMVQMALVCDIVPLVRPTDLSYPLVARSLDAGAQGVIIPRVETRQQAQDTVSFAKYPPIGRRGAGGDGRNGYERRTAQQSVDESNAETLIVLQLESQAGVDNLDAIASVEGVDVICVGPQDLSISLGIAGDFGHPTFVETLRHVTETCAKHGVATGMVEREPGAMQRWHEMGMRFLVCNTDANMLVQGATRDVEGLRAFAPRP